MGARHIGLVFKVAKARMLSEYAGLPTLNLRQMQEMAGKLHRMLMTLPPG